MFWSRLAISVADAVFWLLIIGGIGFTLWVLIRSITSFLLENVTEEEEE